MDLEIGLRWRAGVFDVNIDYDDPGQAADKRQYGVTPVEIDVDALEQLIDDDRAYGTALAEMLFGAEPKIGEFYGKAKAVAEQGDLPLHLRLFLDPAAPQRYQRVRWETLRDPEDGARVATKRNLLVSRFLTDNDWRAYQPPRKHDLRALVAIANPRGLELLAPNGRALAPVRVAEEVARAREALGAMEPTVLASGGSATVERVLAALDEGVDILYLVCHGAIVGGQSRLYLEDAEGSVAHVDGSELAGRISELERRPTLAVLCSCNSAGGESADEGELAPLGPELIKAGVAAVVAMQGNVSMDTAGAFLSAFFAALKVDGVVDRAVAVARGTVRDNADWWAPVLYSRLKRGRTYYATGFGSESRNALQALVGAIAEGWCTPVLGPALSENVLPSRQEVATGWVETWQLPIAPGTREDLTAVAQYLRVRMAARTPALELREFLLRELRQRYAGHLDAELLRTATPADLPALIEARGAQLRAADAPEPFRLLASLALPVYVTTSWTGLLEAALKDAGRTPQVRSFDWYSIRDRLDLELEEPTPQSPLVYHLFGTLDRPASLVLSEDDYFAWLTAWVAKRDIVPNAIMEALTDRSLLFLGYRLDDWDFQVLFQSIKSFGGADLSRNVHVGVQLDPADGKNGAVVEAEIAQEYLESYFGADKVNIFWGETRDFLAKMADEGAPGWSR